MATESSAVVRFIDSAQKQHQTIQESGAGGAVLPVWARDIKRVRRSVQIPLLILGALLLAVAAALAGFYVGNRYLGGGTSMRHVAAVPAATPAPRVPAAAPGQATEPAASAAAVAPTVAPEVLAATGFDIRVKPPATISLDGRLLGRAPLRVRNLLPGPHVIEVEAPPGFFSRRVDVELDAGEPQNVNLALDPIDPAPVVAAGRDEEPQKSRRDRRRSHRKARSASRRGSHEAQRFDVAGGRRLRPSASADLGTLLVGSKPPCDIYIDGAATGLKTPQRAIELSAGSHKVTLVNRDLGIRKTFTVEIEPGKSIRAIHDLTGKID